MMLTGHKIICRQDGITFLASFAKPTSTLHQATARLARFVQPSFCRHGLPANPLHDMHCTPLRSIIFRLCSASMH